MNSNLKTLFEKHFSEAVDSFKPLKAHGSNRKRYRLKSKKHTAIGVENDDRAENTAFLEFSKHFGKLGLPVPEIYAENLDANIYLEEDLGNDTLFELMEKLRPNKNEFPSELEHLYTRVVEMLPEFQIKGGKKLNYKFCYPRHSFDRQSIMWDLSYFKYYFLKLAGISFNEQKLEDDYNRFADFLLETRHDFFLYRDFQSRNIMIRAGRPYFIDYQGGRKGALQYDIASLLFDAKANLPFEVREKLLQAYLNKLSKLTKIDRDEFMKYYYGYTLVRIMQAMGAYGFRGFYERKTHFLQSVPFAIRNLEYVLHNVSLPVEMPMLLSCLQKIVRSTKLREIGNVQLPLTVHIQSFSYKNGLPVDETGHGGGFIFDCRSLTNPGRLDKYKKQNGNDKGVIQFLEGQPEVHSFLTRVRDLISQVIEKYEQRSFTHLSVAFGCTGGQHRSVFCANSLSKYLAEKYGVKIKLMHREESDWINLK